MRKICVVVASRANYGRIKSLMRSVETHPELQLKVVVTASALLYRFGSAIDIIRRDGFEPAAISHIVVEGDTPSTMAKSTGLGIIELTSIFESIVPDVVLTVADRYETMATAIAASYMNIPLAHTQGGEVTGSIDESVRHAVTKLAHIHFPASQQAADNIARMGEDPEKIFLTGCPSIDLLTENDLLLPPEFFNVSGGVGMPINSEQPYLVVLQHPITTEYGHSGQQVAETLEAIRRIGMHTVWLWPNVDAGSDEISKRLRTFREGTPAAPIHFFRNFPPEDYARLIANCTCLVGNSSSAIREGAFLGVPAVNIGNRQRGRECGPNVIHVPYDAAAIENAIKKQLAHGRYKRSPIFGSGSAGKQIAQVLAHVDLDTNKLLSYG